MDNDCLEGALAGLLVGGLIVLVATIAIVQRVTPA